MVSFLVHKLSISFRVAQYGKEAYKKYKGIINISLSFHKDKHYLVSGEWFR